jgi:hypothetical protein
MWWLTIYFADHVDIFHMFAELGNDKRKEMQLIFQDPCNLSVFITTPKVGRRGQNPPAGNCAVITWKFWVQNEQQLAFSLVVWLGQNRVPNTW